MSTMSHPMGYLFKDRRWILKCFIGGAMLMVPLLNFIALGYVARIVKDAIVSKDPVLPDFNQCEEDFTTGFFVFVIMLAYGFLGILLSLLCFVPYTAVLVLGIMISVVYFLVATPMSAIAVCRYLETGNFFSAFNILDVLSILKSRLNSFLIVSILQLVLTVVLSGITFPFLRVYALFYISSFFTFVITVIAARFYGDIYTGKDLIPAVKPAQSEKTAEESPQKPAPKTRKKQQ